MRLRKIRQRLSRLPEFKHQILDEPEQYLGNWRQTFGGSRLFVEVGTGKGMFLTELASRIPSNVYVGIERFTPVLATAAKRVKEKELSNVKFLDEDVANLLNFFGPGEVDGIYINFVDPWPRKKHAKRRLTHPNFLRLYAQVLKPGGIIQLKTDSESLFEFSLNQFADAGYRLHGITFDLHKSSYETENVWTEYETKFAEQGLKIFRCEAFKHGTIGLS